MTQPLLPDAILRLRLANQLLATQTLTDPAGVVAHFGAVQSQDYPAAKWALGLRLQDATEQQVECAFAEGKILRTHVLRPTWHFVAPADIRWLLKLSAPRLETSMRAYTRGLGLDPPMLTRCELVLERALQGGKSLSRPEVGAALRDAGIDVRDNTVLAHMLGLAELDGVLCSGPPRGRVQTYALLDERVAAAPLFEGDDALAELTWRYFSSHGPALVQDCMWWASLSMRAVRRGLEMNRGRLACEVVDGQHYWFGPAAVPSQMPETAQLLPNYDEYTVAYRHRALYYDTQRNRTGNARLDVPFRNVILLDGRVAGRWNRVLNPRGGVRVETEWTIDAAEARRAALEAAIERYRVFLGCEPAR